MENFRSVAGNLSIWAMNADSKKDCARQNDLIEHWHILWILRRET